MEQKLSIVECQNISIIRYPEERCVIVQFQFTPYIEKTMEFDTAKEARELISDFQHCLVYQRQLDEKGLPLDDSFDSPHEQDMYIDICEWMEDGTIEVYINIYNEIDVSFRVGSLEEAKQIAKNLQTCKVKSITNK